MYAGNVPKVVLVQRDSEAAEVYAEWLRSDGLHVIQCVGPSAPHYACYMLETSICPIAAGADLLIYDPWINCDTDEADASGLIGGLRARYGTIPILIVASDYGFPSGLVNLASQDRGVELLFRPTRLRLLQEVSELLAARPARPLQSFLAEQPYIARSA